MDTSQLVAGNLASRSATMHSADIGIQQAVTWIQANAATGALSTDAPNSGYYAEAVEEPWTSASFWSRCTSCMSTDNAHNTVSYVINRMCLVSGAASGVGNFCSSQAGTSSSGASQSSDSPTFPAAPIYYYRITVQVVDQRNTATLSQAFITL
jgi:hypothetical protein